MGKPNLELTDRDLRLLAKLGQMPALSTREIYKIFYSELAEKHAYRRLGQLFRGGYLLRYPYLGPLFGNTFPEHRKITSLYALSTRGALAAGTGNAPRAFKTHHWLYYFQSVLFSNLVEKGVLSHSNWNYSGYIKANSTKFERWEPFHAQISLPKVRFYLYFLQQPLKNKFAGTLRRFGHSLYSRFRYEKDRSVRRYFLIVSPVEDYRNNLRKLAVESIIYMHVVTYSRAASVIFGLSKDRDYFLNALVNRAGLPGLFYGDAMDVFRHYTKRNGRKLYLADMASGAINTAYKLTSCRANISVAVLSWPETKSLFKQPNLEVTTIDTY